MRGMDVECPGMWYDGIMRCSMVWQVSADPGVSVIKMSCCLSQTVVQDRE